MAQDVGCPVGLQTKNAYKETIQAVFDQSALRSY